MAHRDQLNEVMLVILLTSMWGFVGANRAGIGFVLPALLPEFQLEFWQAGLLVSGPVLLWACSAWMSGSVSDRMGRRNVLLVGMYAASVFSAVFGLTWNFLSAFIARDLLGLGDGVGNAVGQSIIAERTDPNRRALYQGIFTGGAGILGLGAGAFVITHVTTAFGWRWAFPVVGLFGLVITTALLLVLPRDLPAQERSSGRLQVEWFFGDFQEIIRVRGVIHVIIAGTLGLAWFALTIAFTPLFLTRVRGYSLDEAGSMLAIATSIGFLGSVLLPALSDSLGRKPVGIAGAIGAGLIYIVFPLVPMPTPALVALLTFGGICAGGLVSLTVATLLSELVPGRRGAAIGIANFLSATLGSLLSPIYGGVLADHFGLALPLVLAGVFQLLTAPVLCGVPETAPRVLARRGTAAKAAQPTSP